MPKKAGKKKATKPKGSYQKTVMPVVGKEMRKIKKAHPKMKQTEVMKEAWKSKSVLAAKKKFIKK